MIGADESSVIDELSAVGLDELNATAALQTRIDRKYVITLAQLDELLQLVAATARVLDIDDRRTFAYETLYFDTPALHSYFASARRRPNRFKVRTRTYLDAGKCMVEVKLRDSRGQTVKHRQNHGVDDRHELTPSALAFVETFPALRHFGSDLVPVLTTRYQRSTLLVGEDRSTIDFGVTCDDGSGSVAGFPERVLIETKCARHPGTLDRALWSMHNRPITISKFGTGLAALRPDLAANKWHRILQHHVLVFDRDVPDATGSPTTS